MEILSEFLARFIEQLQSPTLAFLLAGIAAAAVKSNLRIPDSIYQFCVYMLLMRIGLNAGLAIRDGNIIEMFLPAFFCAILGVSIVLLGLLTIARLPGVRKEDALATSGLFGAVSAATLAAGMLILESENIFYETWVPALYPFMDIPALITAIVLANIYLSKKNGGAGTKVAIWPIVKDCFRGTALTVMIMGIILGLITKPEVIFTEFYNPLFRGFLSVLMLIMGMEAYKRIREFVKVAHWYAMYAIASPIVHGFMGFGLGYVVHLLGGFSPGGVIMLAILAASNSDISGPPTLRVGIPTANPSTYIGASTGIGTPVAIGICIPLFLTLGRMVFGF